MVESEKERYSVTKSAEQYFLNKHFGNCLKLEKIQKDPVTKNANSNANILMIIVENSQTGVLHR